jgi:hypothetical protein
VSAQAPEPMEGVPEPVEGAPGWCVRMVRTVGEQMNGYAPVAFHGDRWGPTVYDGQLHGSGSTPVPVVLALLRRAGAL